MEDGCTAFEEHYWNSFCLIKFGVVSTYTYVHAPARMCGKRVFSGKDDSRTLHAISCLICIHCLNKNPIKFNLRTLYGAQEKNVFACWVMIEARARIRRSWFPAPHKQTPFPSIHPSLGRECTFFLSFFKNPSCFIYLFLFLLNPILFCLVAFLLFASIDWTEWLNHFRLRFVP